MLIARSSCRLLLCFCLFIGWGVLTQLYGQTSQTPFTIRHYGVAEGLSNEWVSDITQDSAGYLWIATQYGLNRFDGLDFKAYTYRADIGSGPLTNWSKKLLTAGPEELWIGSLGRGLSIMHTSNEEFLDAATLAGWPAMQVIEDMLEVPEGPRWFATSAGLFRQSERERAPSKIEGSRIRSLTSLSDGTAIGAGADGIWLLPSTGDQRQRISREHCLAVLGLGADSLLYYAEGKLSLLNRKEATWRKTDFSLPVGPVGSEFFLPDLQLSPSNEIWVAANQFVYRANRDLTDWTTYPAAHLLGEGDKKVNVHDLFFDREGNAWWGTDQGLYQLQTALPFHRPLDRFGDDAPKGIREVVSLGDTLFLAGFDGLYYWPKHGEQPPVRIDNERRNALHAGSDGYLYFISEVANEPRIQRLHPGTLTTQTMRSANNQDPVNRCWRIVEDHAGLIWFGGWNELICYNPDTGEQFAIRPTLGGETPQIGTLDLLVDSRDRLWIGSLYEGAMVTGGASQLMAGDQPVFQQYKNIPSDPASLSSTQALQIHETTNGDIWVATDGGLNRYLPESDGFKRHLRGGSLVDDKIITITSDSAGALWLGSISHGIIRYDPATEYFTDYGQKDGLLSNAMLISSVWRDADGDIWMGGQEGLQYFRPAEIRLPTTGGRPVLRCNEYTLFGGDTLVSKPFGAVNYSVEKPLRIEPKYHSIRWRFRALSFLDPETVSYAFKLEGLHDDWLPAAPGGELMLSKLPVGSYILRATATDGKGRWSVEHPPIHLRVIPPWYWSTFAWLVYGGLVFGLVYLIYRLQLRRRIAEARSEQLERLSKEKMGWFNRIAHEFTTPLTVITGAIDRARSRDAGEEGQLALIDGQARYLSGQVSQILELARLQAGAPGGRLTVGDFYQFHGHLLAAHQLLADEKAIRLSFDRPADTLVFPFSEDAWRKITGNLLSKAIKFTQEGGEVGLKLWADADTLHVEVADNGRGMSPEFQRGLFQPFSREDELAPGTGLGLTLARELISSRGGSLRVSSVLGSGSTFRVELPLPTSSAPAAAPETTVGDESPSVERPTILIVEDHPELLDYISFCLRSDYRLLTAANGSKAWEICQSEVPDIVVSDIVMPGMSGVELTERIMESGATNHIPVILLSAKTANEARLEGLAAGAAAYLTKPFQRPELQALIASLASRQQRLREKYGRGDYSVEKATVMADEFVGKVAGLVLERMADEHFGVRELAAELFISRTQLFRKIKALTGKTPTLFIRRLKLVSARKMLVSKTETIAEIAFDHGFKDPAYFSRVYREEFGESPSETRVNKGIGT